mmetsp:Transcript_120439/g.269257  ORF Transcript_120439/g.269257 Transcript_120439/m.269257 type:complete len:342 (-) Transcript_120439:491-1516(-)
MDTWLGPATVQADRGKPLLYVATAPLNLLDDGFAYSTSVQSASSAPDGASVPICTSIMSSSSARPSPGSASVPATGAAGATTASAAGAGAGASSSFSLSSDALTSLSPESDKAAASGAWAELRRKGSSSTSHSLRTGAAATGRRGAPPAPFPPGLQLSLRPSLRVAILTPPRFRNEARSAPPRRSRLAWSSPRARAAAVKSPRPQRATPAPSAWALTCAASPIFGTCRRAPATTCSISPPTPRSVCSTSMETLRASCLVWCTPAAAPFLKPSMEEAVRPKRSIQPGMRPTPSSWAKALAKSRQLWPMRLYSGPRQQARSRSKTASTSDLLRAVGPIVTVAR